MPDILGPTCATFNFLFWKGKKNQHEIVLVEQFSFARVHNYSLYLVFKST